MTYIESGNMRVLVSERRIGVDLDGVLGDLIEGLIDEAFKRYKVRITPEDVLSFKLEDCTELTSEQVAKLLRSREVFQKLHPIIYSQEAMFRLHEEDWNISIITDRDIKVKGITERWLLKNCFHWNQLFFIRADQKANFAFEKHITVFVEDRLETALSLSGKCKKVFLMDRPYNQGELPTNIKRVNSWIEIVQEIL